ncbi:hypothetical protein ABZ920_11645 [Streptomyces sp. NPDC046831]|uniref:hypothetical protein n=1 Tax=Streptomyces sp. NPDC046831 TaxID=3154805 RepID=UPI0033C36A81
MGKLPDEALAVLGLPAMPAAFGDRSEPLADVPGAQVVERRSFFRAIRESLASESTDASGGALPPLS